MMFLQTWIRTLKKPDNPEKRAKLASPESLVRQGKVAANTLDAVDGVDEIAVARRPRLNKLAYFFLPIK